MKLKRLSLIMVLALGFLTFGTLFSTTSAAFPGFGQEALPTAVPTPAAPDAYKVIPPDVPGSQSPDVPEPDHLVHPCGGMLPEPPFQGISPQSIISVPGVCGSGYGDLAVWQADGHSYAAIARFGGAAFHIFNVDDPANPTVARSFTLPNGGSATLNIFAWKKGANHYLSVGPRGSSPACGFHIYNVNDPANPVFVSRKQGTDWCTIHEQFVSTNANGDADYAWLSMSGEGGSGDKMVVLDLADVTNPVETGRYERPDRASFIHDTTVFGNRVYIAHWTGGLIILDKAVAAVTVDPPSLNPVDSIRPAGFSVHQAWPTTDGNHVFIEDEVTSTASFEKVRMYNISDITNPYYEAGIILAGNAATSQAHNLGVQNISPGIDRLYVAWYRAGTRGFEVNTNVNPPTIVQTIRHELRAPGSGYGGAWGIDYLPCTVRGQPTTCIYTADYQSFGLVIDALGEDPMLDPYAPESAITDPTNGQVITTNSYTIQGTAHDYYSGVDAVEVSTNDGATWQPATGTTTWTYNWNIPGNGTYVLKARATDVAGNVQTLFTPITVTVNAGGGCNPENAQVDIVDFAFDPQSLTVAVGSTVQWTNLDSSAHTSTSAGNWDSGNLNQNQSFSHTFNTIGTFNYVCTYHPAMTGTITVIAACTPTVVPPTNTTVPSSTVPPSSTTVATGTSTVMPSATGTTAPTNTSVSGTPVPTTCPIQFSDVPSTDTFYTNIRCLACRGIVSGYSDGTFRPNNQVTRGQLAKMVSNSAGFSEPVSGQTFEDVPPTNTFYQWIERLTTRGYMTGYPCTPGPGPEPCLPQGRPYFRPFANATRGQTAKIVSNAAGFTEPPVGETFEDVKPTNTFYQFIQRLAARNVMQGYACGGPGEPCVEPENKPYFRPNNDVTRGQSSKIVANAFFPNCDTP